MCCSRGGPWPGAADSQKVGSVLPDCGPEPPRVGVPEGVGSALPSFSGVVQAVSLVCLSFRVSVKCQREVGDGRNPEGRLGLPTALSECLG